MKGRVNVIEESYKHYRFKNERYKVSADYEEYKNIANAFFKKFFEKLVTTGFLIEMPSRLGAFVLEQYDTDKYKSEMEKKGKSVWNRDVFSEKRHRAAYGFHKDIYYTTEETDGKMWTFSWLKGAKGAFRNKHLYSFTLVRSNVRSSSNKDYSDKSKRLTVHDFFKEEGYKLYRQVYRNYYNKYKQSNNSENASD
jgi:hypothetical protein